MAFERLKAVAAISVFALATACATTETPVNPNTNFSDEAAKQRKCNFGEDLAALEAVKDAISSSDAPRKVVMDQMDTLNGLIKKAENISSSSRPEDALGCRFLEMEARALMIELPIQQGQSDPYTSAKEAVDDVKTLCTTTDDVRMCSAARLHDATLFSRRSAAELARIAAEASDVPINWSTTRSLTQSFSEHVRLKWPSYLVDQQDIEDSTNTAIERTLFASACEADKATTKINRRVGLSINKDEEGKLVPYGKDSGELLANVAVAMDLSPSDACNINPTGRACRGRLAGIVHLACLRAGMSVGN